MRQAWSRIQVCHCGPAGVTLRSHISAQRVPFPHPICTPAPHAPAVCTALSIPHIFHASCHPFNAPTGVSSPAIQARLFVLGRTAARSSVTSSPALPLPAQDVRRTTLRRRGLSRRICRMVLRGGCGLGGRRGRAWGRGLLLVLPLSGCVAVSTLIASVAMRSAYFGRRCSVYGIKEWSSKCGSCIWATAGVWLSRSVRQN